MIGALPHGGAGYLSVDGLLLPVGLQEARGTPLASDRHD